MHRSSKLIVATIAATSAFSASAQAADPATTVYQAEGSNMGICGAFLGTQQVRDDVNRIIRLNGDLLGIPNPGALFRIRARQETSLPPAQECLQRRQP